MSRFIWSKLIVSFLKDGKWIAFVATLAPALTLSQRPVAPSIKAPVTSAHNANLPTLYFYHQLNTLV